MGFEVSLANFELLPQLKNKQTKHEIKWHVELKGKCDI